MAFGSDLALKLIIAAQDLTGTAVKSARDGIQSISTTAEKVYQAAKTWLNFQISIGGAEKLLNLGDTWESLKARIKLASDTQEEFNTAQRGLFAIAQETRSDLESTVALYTKTENAVRKLGGSEQDALNLTRAIAQSFKISGASASESSAGIQQLSQALGSGVLRGDEFNSVMESSPRLALALADGLGVPIERLRAMAEQGQLTADKVIGALLSQKDKLAQEYAQLPVTVSGAVTQAGNALLKYVGELNASYGVTQKVAAGIQLAAEHIADLGTAVVAAAGLLAGQGLKALTGYADGLYRTVTAARAQKAATLEARAAQLQTLEASAAAAAQTVREADAKAVYTAKIEAAAKADLLAAQAKTNASKGSLAAMEAELAAEARLAAAENSRRTAQREAATAATTAAEAQTRLQAGLETSAAKASLAERAFGALNKGFSLLQAGIVGWEIGQWLNKFETIRIAGSYLGETIARLGTVWKVFTGDLSAAQGKAELANIKKEFDDIRTTLTDTYQAGQEKTKSFADSQQQLQSALGQVKAGLGGVADQAPVTTEQIGKLKTAMDEAVKVAGAKTEALRKLQAGTAEYAAAEGAAKEANSQASAAVAAYTKALSDAVTQSDRQIAISKSLGSQLEAEYGQRKAVLEKQLAAAQAAGDEAEAIRILGNLKAEEVRHAGESARAKRAEAEAAEAHAEALAKQAQATSGVDQEEQKHIVTAKANAAAAREAATAAETHYQALSKLPASLQAVRTEQGLTTQQIANFKQAAEAALGSVQQMEALYRDGKVSLVALADAQAAAAGKLEQYTQALKLQAEQLRANEAAISREAGLDRQRVTNKLEAVRAAEQAARAAGLETEAARLGIEAKRLEAQQEQISSTEKSKLAEAAAQVAANLEAQAQADGVLTTAEQSAIQAAKDNAEAKKLEAEQSRIAASAKRAEADAAEKEANTKKTSKQATDEATDSQDKLNQSQSDSVQILTAGEKALTAYTQAVNVYGNLDLGLKIANDSIAQKAHLESLKASLDAAANSGQGLGDAMRKAGLSSDLSGVSIDDLRQRFEWLDDTDLSSLLSSVNSVRSAVQSLRDSTASTLSTLQDELDSLTGNEQAKTEREYQAKKAELDAAYQEAVNARDAQSQSSALKAIKLLEEIHQRKMAAFDEEAKAKQKSEETASRPNDQPRTTTPTRTDQSQPAPAPSSPTDTIRLELAPIGSSRIIPATVDRRFKDDLLDLKRSKQAQA